MSKNAFVIKHSDAIYKYLYSRAYICIYLFLTLVFYMFSNITRVLTFFTGMSTTAVSCWVWTSDKIKLLTCTVAHV